MAAKTHGTAWLYGITETAWTNTTILSVNYERTDKNEDYVPNQDGQVAHIRADDERTTASFTFQFTGSYVEPEINNTVTIADASEVSRYEGTYLVKGVSKPKAAKGFVTITLTLERDEYMTYAAN